MPLSPPPTPSGPPPVGPAAPRPAGARTAWALVASGALAAAILLGAGNWMGRWREPPPIAIHPPPTVTPLPSPSPTPSPAPLVVFVSGAVAAPGLVTLPPGARAGDALAAAGGLLPEADPAAVNQATPLVDGAQVHVPARTAQTDGADTGGGGGGIILPTPTPPPDQPPDQTRGQTTTGGPININTATQAELESLPGIGPALAAAIMAERPFAAVEELDRVPGIGPAKLADLQGLVTVE